MRRSLLLSLSVTVLMLAGCSKPKDGECKTGDDCKEQQGYGKVCVEGRCQECGADTDCKSGFVCKQNKCAPRPECSQSSDCGAGKSCEDGRCVTSQAECTSDAQCGTGKACEAGTCVTKAGDAGAAGCGGEENAVRFGFDSSDLDAEARSALEKVAGCIKTAGKVSVEGHCDERGTTEYNLHLGERRAEAVRKYLVNLGLAGKKLKAVSFGKERPLCTESTEDCWAKNRRGVVVPGAAE